MTFKSIFLCFWLCVGFALFSFTGVDSPRETKKNVVGFNAIPSIEKFNSVTKLRNELFAIDSIQAGVCDTCYSSVTGVIIENRIMVEKISRQNYEMQELIISNENQLNRLKMCNTKMAFILLRSKNELSDYAENIAFSPKERKFRK